MDSPPDNDFCSSASASFIALPMSEVRGLCQKYPQIYPVIIRQIGRRLRLLMEWTGQSVLVDSVQRVAKLLHILAREQQVNAGYAKLNVTQTRVATLSRCSRQTANEILGVLEQKGLVSLAYGCVEIPDMGRLAVFADAGPYGQ
jgi:CRP-like cAMP-binding protein